MRRVFVLVVICVAALASHAGLAQEGRMVLVLPFGNVSQQQSVDWIANSFPSVLNQRLNSAGFSTVAREDRLYALDRLGLPANLKPSHAMALRIAQEMDVDYVVYGSYSTDGANISINARVLDVRNLHLSAELHQQDALTQLIRAENGICWDVIRAINPAYSVDRAAFLAAAPTLPLNAFESYIRGVLATNQTDRIRRYQATLAEAPDYVPAMYGLARAEFDGQQYEQAAAAFARVPSDHPLALQAAFYLGLAQFYSGKYTEAEQSFAFVAARIPLPEIINNQGVAGSRHGKQSTSLFQQAVNADPKDEDYRYNLAVSLRRQKDVAGARREIGEALKLKPNDQEAKELQTLLLSGNTAGSGDEGIEPLERLKRDVNLSEIRQASQAVQQIEQMRLAQLPPAQRGQEQTQRGDTALAQGLTLEAEQEYQQAVTADHRNWRAHAGLAQVRNRTGNYADAVTEAKASVAIQPNAPAYIEMASAEFALHDMPAAAAATASALRLEPANAAALAMKTNLARRGVALP